MGGWVETSLPSAHTPLHSLYLQASSSSEEEVEEEEEEEEEVVEEEGQALCEIRWFWTPHELLPKKEDRAKCLRLELFESDRVDEVPVVSPSTHPPTHPPA